MTNNVNGGYSISTTKMTEILANATDAQKTAVNEAAADGLITQSELLDLTGAVDSNILLNLVSASTYQSATAQTNSSATTGSADEIDEKKTEAFRSTLSNVQEDYNSKIDKEEGLRADLDDANSEMEDIQDVLEKAVDNMQKKAEDSAENANTQSAEIIKKIKSGEMTQSEGKTALAGIGFDDLSSEERTISDKTYTMESLASEMERLSTVYTRVADAIGTLADTYGQLLETDVDSIYVNTMGQLVINEPGENGPEASGAEGVSAADMSKFAAMSTEDLAKELESGSATALYEAMNSMAGDSGQSLSTTEAAELIKNLVASQKTTSTADASYGIVGQGAVLNTINGVDAATLKDAISDKCAEKAAKKSCDPYVVTIDGKTYQFMKENGDGKWDTADIFGINDTKDNTFASMKDADINGDGAVSAEELQKQGIRLVEVNNGKLQVNDSSKDYDLSKIDSINLNTLRDSSDNNGVTGTFGNFDLKLKDGRTIEGDQTFESESTLQKMFNSVKKFFSGTLEKVQNSFKLDEDTVKLYSGIGDYAKQMADIKSATSEAAVEGVSELEDATETNIAAAANTKAPEAQQPAQKEPSVDEQKKKKLQEAQEAQ